MKILLCLNKDVFSLMMFNFLLPYFRSKKFVITIIMTNSVGKQVVSDITKIEKIIPLEGIFPTLESINHQRKFLTFSDMVDHNEITLHEVTTINNSFGENLVSQNDIILSIRFGSIFKERVIGKAKGKILNLHSAILPNYKGILGTFQALSNKDKKIGATLHFISDGTIDTGDILHITQFKANYETSLFQNIFSLYKESVEPIQNILDKIINSEQIETMPQKADEGKYFTAPTLEEIEKFASEVMPIYTENDINEIINLFG